MWCTSSELVSLVLCLMVLTDISSFYSCRKWTLKKSGFDMTMLVCDQVSQLLICSAVFFFIYVSICFWFFFLEVIGFTN